VVECLWVFHHVGFFLWPRPVSLDGFLSDYRRGDLGKNHLMAQRFRFHATYAFSTLYVLLVAASAQAGTSWTLEPGAGDVVNIQDIELIASNWLSTGQAGIPGDYSGDGMVNTKDLDVVASNWGASGPDAGSPGSGGQVPEPSTALVFGVWAIGLWLVRRRARA
jgi:hypothetical protein